MELQIEVRGDVVEWQELLNGTQIVTLQGASGDGEWVMTGGVSWNIGLAGTPGEGDITLERRDGAEIFGTLTSADVEDIAESEATGADYRLHVEYDIDGGSGDFDPAEGRATGDGDLSREAFRLRLTLSLGG